jgi:Asp-tRNA(Asn)/Glu-tRNA(Gln) amidotransferase A subunit family amidase
LLGEDGVLILPTLGTLAPRHGEMNRLSFRPGVNKLLTPLTLCNYLNLPAVTIPAWRMKDAASGLPPGVMLVARPGSEAMLLEVAEWAETSIGLPPSGGD